MCLSVPPVPWHPAVMAMWPFCLLVTYITFRRAKILFSLVRVSDGVLLDGYVWHSGMLECGLGILWDSQGLSAPETDKKSYSGVKSWAYDDKLMQKVLVDWIRAYDLGPRPTWGSCFGFYHPGIKNYNSKVPLPTFSRSTQGNTF